MVVQTDADTDADLLSSARTDADSALAGADLPRGRTRIFRADSG